MTPAFLFRIRDLLRRLAIFRICFREAELANHWRPASPAGLWILAGALTIATLPSSVGAIKISFSFGFGNTSRRGFQTEFSHRAGADREIWAGRNRAVG